MTDDGKNADDGAYDRHGDDFRDGDRGDCGVTRRPE